jgi:hypothetical protein
MNSPAAIGLICGFVSALLMSTAASENFAAYLLLCLVPLPVFLAGLGWGALASMIALAAGAAISHVFLGAPGAPSFLILFGTPAAILSYITVTPHGRSGWRSAGTLAIAAALAAACFSACLFLLLGSERYGAMISAAAANENINALFLRLPGVPLGLTAPETKALLYVSLPAAFSAAWCGVLLLNLWAGLRTVHMSARLPRPAPLFLHMRFPLTILLACAVSTAAGLLLPDLAGRVALCFAGAFAAAYLILGLAVLCVLTEGMTWQVPVFIGVAAIGVMFRLPAVAVLIAFGAADSVFNFRRIPRKPPSPQSGGTAPV